MVNIGQDITANIYYILNIQYGKSKILIMGIVIATVTFPLLFHQQTIILPLPL
jgi:hypothetical protein